MRWSTGLNNPDPEEIHALGLAEIAKLKPKVMALAQQLGYNKGSSRARTMKQLFDKVSSEPGQVFKVKRKRYHLE